MHHAAFSQHGSRALAQGPSQVNIESGLEACFAQLSILIFLSLKLFSVRDTYSRLNMAALGDEQVENNAAPTEVDSDSEVSCITGHLLESDGAVEIEEIVGPIWIPREYKQDTPSGEEDVPPPAKRIRSKIANRDITIQVKQKSTHLNLKQIVQKMQRRDFHRNSSEHTTQSESQPTPSKI